MARPALHLPLCALLAAVAFLMGCSRPDEGARSDASASELLRVGAAALERGEPAAAIAAYRMALHRDSLDVEALAGLSQAYRLQGRAFAADQYLRRAVHLTYTGGLAALEAGDRPAARQAFDRTLALLPRHPLALIRLGDLAREDGRLTDAIDLYRRATGANPEFAESFIKLAEACVAAGEDDDATAAYGSAIQLNLNAFDAYVGLGRIHSRKGEWQLAAEQFGKALLIQPQSEMAAAGLARARQNL